MREQVEAAIKEMEATMRKYREYGATDTEPDVEFYSMRCGDAGRALSKSCRALCKLIVKNRNARRVDPL